jgi:uncharacterized protein
VRIVVDTNLLVSGYISPGTPRRLLDAAYDEVYELCTSEALLAELLDVLGRTHIAPRLQRAGLTAAAAVEDLRRIATIVTPAAVPRVVPTDADDDHVLAAALAAGADLVASGDRRDLLPLGSYQGIPIVTARVALERLGLSG